MVKPIANKRSIPPNLKKLLIIAMIIFCLILLTLATLLLMKKPIPKLSPDINASTALDQLLPLFSKNITWTERESNSTGLIGTIPASIPVYPDGIISESEITRMGWYRDSSLDGGGPGGMVWGYRRMVDDQNQTLILMSQSDFINGKSPTEIQISVSSKSLDIPLPTNINWIYVPNFTYEGALGLIKNTQVDIVDLPGQQWVFDNSDGREESVNQLLESFTRDSGDWQMSIKKSGWKIQPGWGEGPSAWGMGKLKINQFGQVQVLIWKTHPDPEPMSESQMLGFTKTTFSVFLSEPVSIASIFPGN